MIFWRNRIPFCCFTNAENSDKVQKECVHRFRKLNKTGCTGILIFNRECSESLQQSTLLWVFVNPHSKYHWGNRFGKVNEENTSQETCRTAKSPCFRWRNHVWCWKRKIMQSHAIRRGERTLFLLYRKLRCNIPIKQKQKFISGCEGE